MTERSDSAGVVLAIGVALMLILLLIGGGLGFLFFARQATMVRAEAARARAAEIHARQQALQAEKAALAERESAQGKLAEKSPTPSDNGSITTAIAAVLLAQQQAWNAGNIDQFVEHYWKSDELTFSSGGKTTRGWDNTLQRYRQRYSTPEQMGKLKLDQFEITPLNGTAALVLGNWQIDRASEPVSGNFSLILRKIGDRWFIIHDHTSQLVE
jgi:hypothetical protein